MKRESFRKTLATAVAIFALLLAAPIYGRAKQDTSKDASPKSVIEILMTWANSRLVPPWPEPGEDDPTTTDLTDTTGTDTTGTDTTDTTGT